MKILEEKTKVAVLLACHNRRVLTVRCLKSLAEQSLLDSSIEVEIFLTDDGSNDGTSAAVLDCYPGANLFFGDGSLFWNRGMHMAFEGAIEKDGFDFYLWLNDDCILYQDTLSVLLNSYKKIEEATGSSAHIIGSAMQDSETKAFTYGGVKKHSSVVGRITQSRIAPDSVNPIECHAVNGNCVLISAEVVARIGNLDPIYTHRWGDHDYCFRSLRAGCMVWLAPGFRGSCSSNSITGTWQDTKLPIKSRIEALRSHKGYAPNDYLVYLRRHRGVWWFVSYWSPYVKILLSSLFGIKFKVRH